MHALMHALSSTIQQYITFSFNRATYTPEQVPGDTRCPVELHGGIIRRVLPVSAVLPFCIPGHTWHEDMLSCNSIAAHNKQRINSQVQLRLCGT